MENNYKMKELPEELRPYERCQKFGAEVLSDAELLAVLIKSGTRKKSAYQVALDVLNLHPAEKGLAGVSKLSLEQFTTIPGIGKIKATQILCAIELSKRLVRTSRNQVPCFQSPDRIAQYYMEEYRCLTQEQVLLLMLDTKNQLLKQMVISKGTVNSSVITPREVFVEALRTGAVNIILLHNHPSGDPTPSEADILITKRMKETGDLIGIALLDHIIIGDKKYISLKQKKWI